MQELMVVAKRICCKQNEMGLEFVMYGWKHLPLWSKVPYSTQ